MPVAPWWEEFGSAASSDRQPSDSQPADSQPAGRPPEDGPAPDDPSARGAGVEVHRTSRRRPRGLRALQVSAAVLGAALVTLLVVITVRTGGEPVAVSTARSGAPPSQSPSSQSPPSQGPSSQSPSSEGSSSAPVATDDAAALRELEALRARGLAAHPPAGQWAAQLAAKSIGTTDAAQVAANGSHTFYAGDILAQSRRIAAGPAGADVFVLRSDDYGKGSIDARGNPFWTTLAAGPFASAADVQTWCDSVFGDVPAATRGNVCLPRQLLPVR